jgi:hypothetical protein
MALDPNIALGIRPMELANPLAQYGQIAQIQNAQNQNALAQYQLGSAQRQEATQNALSDAYKSAFNPDTGKIDEQALIKGLAARNAGHLIPDIQAKLLTTQKEQGLIGKTKVETESAQFKLANDKLKHGLESLTSAPTPQDAIEKLNDGVTKGFFDMKTASAEALKLQNMTPQDYQKYRIEKILGLVDNKDRLTAMLPKVHRQDIGGSIANIQDNPMLPGYGQPVANMPNIAKTATIGERTAQGQLGLAQQKFAFEQANPGFELKEDSDGNFFGVNKRTLQAVPVTVGGGAPAAAPAVSGAGMPGPRMAQPSVVQAIPGMTSVLDQTAPAAAVAPVAGGPRQLVGKGTAMTENQSKSAMFGAAMNQANNIISKVEKEGTTTAPVAVSVLQGLARLSPQFLGTGENAANAIESVFRQDPTSLLGPDVNQQKLGQAQIAFATAYLRATSGASFGPSEVSNTIKEYFPLIGEDKAVVKQKAEARQRAIEGMKISTSKQGQSYIDQSGANANDPLGILGGKR